MKSLITFILLSAALAALLTGCGFKSDLYLSDITPVPETVITDFPPLPTLPPADGSANPDSVVVEIPPLEDEAEKKNTN